MKNLISDEPGVKISYLDKTYVRKVLSQNTPEPPGDMPTYCMIRQRLKEEGITNLPVFELHNGRVRLVYNSKMFQHYDYDSHPEKVPVVLFGHIGEKAARAWGEEQIEPSRKLISEVEKRTKIA